MTKWDKTVSQMEQEQPVRKRLLSYRLETVTEK